MWYYGKNGTQFGPISAKEIAILIRGRTLGANDMVWREGMTDWIRVNDSALAVALPSVPPPLPDASSKDETESVISVKKKAPFLDSQLAEILFDALSIDPDDYDDEEYLLGDLSERLTELVTLEQRAIVALDIDVKSKNKFDLFSQRLEEIIDVLDDYDENGDDATEDVDLL